LICSEELSLFIESNCFQASSTNHEDITHLPPTHNTKVTMKCFYVFLATITTITVASPTRPPPTPPNGHLKNIYLPQKPHKEFKEWVQSPDNDNSKCPTFMPDACKCAKFQDRNRDK
jgi:hypothetical protein